MKGFKRIVSMFMAFFLVLSFVPVGSGLSTVAYGASSIGASITGICADALQLQSHNIDLDNIQLDSGWQTLYFTLGASSFEWDTEPNLVGDHGQYYFNLQTLADNGIELVLDQQENNNVFCDAEITGWGYQNPTIKLQLSHELPAWLTSSFEFTLSLSQNGIEEPASRVTIKGSASSKDKWISINRNDDNVYLYADYAAIATEDIEEIGVFPEDISGNSHVTIKTPLRKGEIIYGHIDSQPDATDLQHMQAHPQITDVRKMNFFDTLKNSSISFDDVGESYQIYGLNGNNIIYLGDNSRVAPESEENEPRTFPYYDTYYLAVCKFDETVPSQHKVTYDANGATGGVLPIDNNLYYPGQRVEVIFPYDVDIDWESGETYLYRDDHDFDEWNTKADGTGETYKNWWPDVSRSFYMGNEDITLYAQWSHKNNHILYEVKPKPLTLSNYPDPENLVLRTGDVLLFELTVDDFIWEISEDSVRELFCAELLEGNKVSFKLSFDKGSKAIGDRSIINKDGKVYIAIEASNFVVNKDIPFEIRLHLFLNGRRQLETETHFKGIYPANYTGQGESTGSKKSSGGGGGSSGGASISMAPVKLPVNEQAALSKTESQLKKAIKEGKKSTTVVVNNASEIKLTTLQKMAEAAKKQQGKVLLRANSLNNGKTDLRITFDVANATKDIKLSGSLAAAKTKQKFEKLFENKIAVIRLDQKEDFGMTVTLLAPVNLKGFDTKNLVFYSYNTKTAKYQKMENTNYKIDDQGNLRFDTTCAGDIVISEGPLKKKA